LIDRTVRDRVVWSVFQLLLAIALIDWNDKASKAKSKKQQQRHTPRQAKKRAALLCLWHRVASTQRKRRSPKNIRVFLALVDFCAKFASIPL
jgi:hypothetical protein